MSEENTLDAMKELIKTEGEEKVMALVIHKVNEANDGLFGKALITCMPTADLESILGALSELREVCDLQREHLAKHQKVYDDISEHLLAQEDAGGVIAALDQLGIYLPGITGPRIGDEDLSASADFLAEAEKVRQS